MRFWVLLCIALVSGCADIKENLREKECASDWSGRGFQAGQAGAAMDAEISRHSAHCPNFDAGAFKEGYQKGFARRARPAV
jgi:hypothetical protein